MATVPTAPIPSENAAPEVSAPARDDTPPAPRLISLAAVSAGLAASLVGHAILLLWVLGIWDIIRPLRAEPPPSMMVDLVPAAEVDRPPASPAQQTVADGKPSPQEPAQQPPRQPPQKTPPQQLAQQQPSRPAPAAPIAPPAPYLPDALLEAGPSSPEAEPPPPGLSTAMRLAQELQLPVALPDSEGGGSPAEQGAKLDAPIIEEFKNSVRKCWHTPAEAADDARVKVLIRVALRRDGRIAGEPTLVQAIATPAGPAVVKSAMSALDQCQPYASLPADKYKEWRLLDIAFSAKGVM